MRLVTYLKQYPKHYKFYKKARKYLKLPRYIEYVQFDIADKRVLGFAYYDKLKKRWCIGFRKDPPSINTLLHELIHVAGGDEIEAYDLTPVLIIAIKHDFPPANIFKLFDLSVSDINSILRELGINSIEEYYKLRGVIPTSYEFIEDPSQGLILRPRKGMSEKDIVICFICEIAGGLLFEESPLELKILNKMFEKIKGV